MSYNNPQKVPNYSLHFIKKFVTINNDQIKCDEWKKDGDIDSPVDTDYNYILDIDIVQLVPYNDVEDSCFTYNYANIIPVNKIVKKNIDKVNKYIRETYNGFYVLTVPKYNGFTIPDGIYKVVMNETSIISSIYVDCNITINSNIPDILVKK